jgi:hypothetical protein
MMLIFYCYIQGFPIGQNEIGDFFRLGKVEVLEELVALAGTSSFFFVSPGT